MRPGPVSYDLPPIGTPMSSTEGSLSSGTPLASLHPSLPPLEPDSQSPPRAAPSSIPWVTSSLYRSDSYAADPPEIELSLDDSMADDPPSPRRSDSQQVLRYQPLSTSAPNPPWLASPPGPSPAARLPSLADIPLVLSPLLLTHRAASLSSMHGLAHSPGRENRHPNIPRTSSAVRAGRSLDHKAARPRVRVPLPSANGASLSPSAAEALSQHTDSLFVISPDEDDHPPLPRSLVPSSLPEEQALLSDSTDASLPSTACILHPPNRNMALGRALIHRVRMGMAVYDGCSLTVEEAAATLAIAMVRTAPHTSPTLHTRAQRWANEHHTSNPCTSHAHCMHSPCIACFPRARRIEGACTLHAYEGGVHGPCMDDAHG